MTTPTQTANWDWADELFNGSDFADSFEADDCDFDPETGNHFYFDETGSCVAVTPDGDVIAWQE